MTQLFTVAVRCLHATLLPSYGRLFPVYISFLLWLAFPVQSGAQQPAANTANAYTLGGLLTDSVANEALGFATVVLYGQNEQQVDAVTADSTGRFRLQATAAGRYKLSISFIGYETRILDGIKLDTAYLDLGNISVKPSGESLKGVTITDRKALFQDKGDKLVYNAENDMTNTGGTAADLLQKVPGVSVDPSGNVQLRGSSNLKVLINGKASGIMARSLSDALKMIPASSIRSVEVMTTPSAKYDAEGIGGVINIITKKNLKGFTGALNGTVGNYTQSTGGNLGLKKDKLELGLSWDVKRDREKSVGENTRTNLQNGMPAGNTYQQDERDNTSSSGFVEATANYELDTLNTIGFSANIWGGEWPANRSLLASSTDSLGNRLQYYRQHIDFKNPYYNVELNLSYNRKTRRPGQEFSVLTQYSYVIDNYPYTTDQRNVDNGSLIYREKSINKSNNRELTVQADYAHPLDSAGKKTFETGAKAIIRNANSNYTVENSAYNDPETMISNPARSNVFDYTQQVLSAYAMLKLNFDHGWFFSVGGRLEQTFIKGNFQNNTSVFKIDYTSIVPNVTLSRKIGEDNTLKLSYTQRIARPRVWDLNPYIDASDPRNISTGNPQLQPERIHVLELSHNLSGKNGLNINSSLYMHRLNNSIERVTAVQADGIAYSRNENIGSLIRIGWSESAAKDITKQWSANIDYGLDYVKFSGLDKVNSGWVTRINANTTYRLPKDFSVQATGGYSSGWIWYQGRNYGWHYYMIAIKKEFWDKKASVTFNMANPFEQKLRVRYEEQMPSYRMDAYIDYARPSFRLSFNWKFGQMSEGGKKVKKVENDDNRSSR